MRDKKVAAKTNVLPRSTARKSSQSGAKFEAETLLETLSDEEKQKLKDSLQGDSQKRRAAQTKNIFSILNESKSSPQGDPLALKVAEDVVLIEDEDKLDEKKQEVVIEGADELEEIKNEIDDKIEKEKKDVVVIEDDDKNYGNTPVIDVDRNIEKKSSSPVLKAGVFSNLSKSLKALNTSAATSGKSPTLSMAKSSLSNLTRSPSGSRSSTVVSPTPMSSVILGGAKKHSRSKSARRGEFSAVDLDLILPSRSRSRRSLEPHNLDSDSSHSSIGAKHVSEVKTDRLVKPGRRSRKGSPAPVLPVVSKSKISSSATVTKSKQDIAITREKVNTNKRHTRSSTEPIENISIESRKMKLKIPEKTVKEQMHEVSTDSDKAVLSSPDSCFDDSPVTRLRRFDFSPRSHGFYKAIARGLQPKPLTAISSGTKTQDYDTVLSVTPQTSPRAARGHSYDMSMSPSDRDELDSGRKSKRSAAKAQNSDKSVLSAQTLGNESPREVLEDSYDSPGSTCSSSSVKVHPNVKSLLKHLEESKTKTQVPVICLENITNSPTSGDQGAKLVTSDLEKEFAASIPTEAKRKLTFSPFVELDSDGAEIDQPAVTRKDESKPESDYRNVAKCKLKFQSDETEFQSDDHVNKESEHEVSVEMPDGQKTDTDAPQPDCDETNKDNAKVETTECDVDLSKEIKSEPMQDDSTKTDAEKMENKIATDKTAPEVVPSPCKTEPVKATEKMAPEVEPSPCKTVPVKATEKMAPEVEPNPCKMEPVIATDETAPEVVPSPCKTEPVLATDKTAPKVTVPEVMPSPCKTEPVKHGLLFGLIEKMQTRIPVGQGELPPEPEDEESSEQMSCQAESESSGSSEDSSGEESSSEATGTPVKTEDGSDSESEDESEASSSGDEDGSSEEDGVVASTSTDLKGGSSLTQAEAETGVESMDTSGMDHTYVKGDDVSGRAYQYSAGNGAEGGKDSQDENTVEMMSDELEATSGLPTLAVLAGAVRDRIEGVITNEMPELTREIKQEQGSELEAENTGPIDLLKLLGADESDSSGGRTTPKLVGKLPISVEDKLHVVPGSSSSITGENNNAMGSEGMRQPKDDETAETPKKGSELFAYLTDPDKLNKSLANMQTSSAENSPNLTRTGESLADVVKKEPKDSEEVTSENKTEADKLAVTLPFKMFEKSNTTNDKSNAFVSTELESYLDTKADLQSDILQCDKQLTNTNKPMKYTFGGNVHIDENIVCPDMDNIDGMLFMSFESEESLEAHTIVETNKKICSWHTSFYHRMRHVLNEQERRGVKFGDDILRAHVGKKFKPLSERMAKYRRMLTNQVMKIKRRNLSKKRKEEEEKDNKVAQEAKDLALVREMAAEELEQVDPDTEVGSAYLHRTGKLHWRTQERLLKNLTPEEAKELQSELGLTLKKKRRKLVPFTHKKNTMDKHSNGSDHSLSPEERPSASGSFDKLYQTFGENEVENEEIVGERAEEGEPLDDHEQVRLVQDAVTELLKEKQPGDVSESRYKHPLMRGRSIFETFDMERPKMPSPVKARQLMQGTTKSSFNMFKCDLQGLMKRRLDFAQKRNTEPLKGKKNITKMTITGQSITDVHQAAEEELAESADDDCIISEDVSSILDDGEIRPHTINQRMALFAVSAVRLVKPVIKKGKVVYELEEPPHKSYMSQSRTLVRAMQGKPPGKPQNKLCDKPGCRYGCVCHLCEPQDSEEAGPSSSKTPNRGQRCTKEYCRLGCICESITTKSSPEKCQKPQCRFVCHCENPSTSKEESSHLWKEDTPCDKEYCQLGCVCSSVHSMGVSLSKCSKPECRFLCKCSTEPTLRADGRPSRERRARKESSWLRDMVSWDFLPRGAQLGIDKIAVIQSPPQHLRKPKKQSKTDDPSFQACLTKQQRLTLIPKGYQQSEVEEVATATGQKYRCLLPSDCQSGDSQMDETTSYMNQPVFPRNEMSQPVFPGSEERRGAFVPFRSMSKAAAPVESGTSKPVLPSTQPTKKKGLSGAAKRRRKLAISPTPEELSKYPWLTTSQAKRKHRGSCARVRIYTPTVRDVKCTCCMGNKKRHQTDDSNKFKARLILEKALKRSAAVHNIHDKDGRKMLPGMRRHSADGPSYPSSPGSASIDSFSSHDISSRARHLSERSSQSLSPPPEVFSTQMMLLQPKKKGEGQSPNCRPQLLEIASNCQWLHIRSQLLGYVAQQVKDRSYPPVSKVAISNFLIEILPRAHRPTKIPPHLQASLPKEMYSVRILIKPASTRSFNNSQKPIIIDDDDDLPPEEGIDESLTVVDDGPGTCARIIPWVTKKQQEEIDAKTKSGSGKMDVVVLSDEEKPQEVGEKGANLGSKDEKSLTKVGVDLSEIETVDEKDSNFGSKDEKSPTKVGVDLSEIENFKDEVARIKTDAEAIRKDVKTDEDEQKQTIDNVGFKKSQTSLEEENLIVAEKQTVDVGVKVAADKDEKMCTLEENQVDGLLANDTVKDISEENHDDDQVAMVTETSGDTVKEVDSLKTESLAKVDLSDMNQNAQSVEPMEFDENVPGDDKSDVYQCIKTEISTPTDFLSDTDVMRETETKCLVVEKVGSKDKEEKFKDETDQAAILDSLACLKALSESIDPPVADEVKMETDDSNNLTNEEDGLSNTGSVSQDQVKREEISQHDLESQQEKRSETDVCKDNASPSAEITSESKQNQVLEKSTLEEVLKEEGSTDQAKEEKPEKELPHPTMPALDQPIDVQTDTKGEVCLATVFQSAPEKNIEIGIGAKLSNTCSLSPSDVDSIAAVESNSADQEPFRTISFSSLPESVKAPLARQVYSLMQKTPGTNDILALVKIQPLLLKQVPPSSLQEVTVKVICPRLMINRMHQEQLELPSASPGVEKDELKKTVEKRDELPKEKLSTDANVVQPKQDIHTPVASTSGKVPCLQAEASSTVDDVQVSSLSRRHEQLRLSAEPILEKAVNMAKEFWLQKRSESDEKAEETGDLGAGDAGVSRTERSLGENKSELETMDLDSVPDSPNIDSSKTRERNLFETFGTPERRADVGDDEDSKGSNTAENNTEERPQSPARLPMFIERPSAIPSALSGAIYEDITPVPSPNVGLVIAEPDSTVPSRPPTPQVQSEEVAEKQSTKAMPEDAVDEVIVSRPEDTVIDQKSEDLQASETTKDKDSASQAAAALADIASSVAEELETQKNNDNKDKKADNNLSSDVLSTAAALVAELNRDAGDAKEIPQTSASSDRKESDIEHVDENANPKDTPKTSPKDDSLVINATSVKEGTPRAEGTLISLLKPLSSMIKKSSPSDSPSSKSFVTPPVNLLKKSPFDSPVSSPGSATKMSPAIIVKDQPSPGIKATFTAQLYPDSKLMSLEVKFGKSSPKPASPLSMNNQTDPKVSADKSAPQPSSGSKEETSQGPKCPATAETASQILIASAQSRLGQKFAQTSAPNSPRKPDTPSGSSERKGRRKEKHNILTVPEDEEPVVMQPVKKHKKYKKAHNEKETLYYKNRSYTGDMPVTIVQDGDSEEVVDIDDVSDEESLAKDNKPDEAESDIDILDYDSECELQVVRLLQAASENIHQFYVNPDCALHCPEEMKRKAKVLQQNAKQQEQKEKQAKQTSPESKVRPRTAEGVKKKLPGPTQKPQPTTRKLPTFVNSFREVKTVQKLSDEKGIDPASKAELHRHIFYPPSNEENVLNSEKFPRYDKPSFLKSAPAHSAGTQVVHRKKTPSPGLSNELMKGRSSSDAGLKMQKFQLQGPNVSSQIKAASTPSVQGGLKPVSTPGVQGGLKSTINPGVQGSMRTSPSVQGSSRTSPSVQGSMRTSPSVQGSMRRKTPTGLAGEIIVTVHPSKAGFQTTPSAGVQGDRSATPSPSFQSGQSRATPTPNTQLSNVGTPSQDELSKKIVDDITRQVIKAFGVPPGQVVSVQMVKKPNAGPITGIESTLIQNQTNMGVESPLSISQCSTPKRGSSPTSSTGLSDLPESDPHPYRNKDEHTSKERIRRKEMAGTFNNLRKVLGGENPRTPKVTLIQQAMSSIRALEIKERNLLDEKRISLANLMQSAGKYGMLEVGEMPDVERRKQFVKSLISRKLQEPSSQQQFQTYCNINGVSRPRPRPRTMPIINPPPPQQSFREQTLETRKGGVKKGGQTSEMSKKGFVIVHQKTGATSSLPSEPKKAKLGRPLVSSKKKAKRKKKKKNVNVASQKQDKTPDPKRLDERLPYIGCQGTLQRALQRQRVVPNVGTSADEASQQDNDDELLVIDSELASPAGSDSGSDGMDAESFDDNSEEVAENMLQSVIDDPGHKSLKRKGTFEPLDPNTTKRININIQPGPEDPEILDGWAEIENEKPARSRKQAAPQKCVDLSEVSEGEEPHDSDLQVCNLDEGDSPAEAAEETETSAFMADTEGADKDADAVEDATFDTDFNSVMITDVKSLKPEDSETFNIDSLNEAAR